MKSFFDSNIKNDQAWYAQLPTWTKSEPKGNQSEIRNFQRHYLLNKVEQMSQNVFTSAEIWDSVVPKIYQHLHYKSLETIVTKTIEFDAKRDEY